MKKIVGICIALLLLILSCSYVPATINEASLGASGMGDTARYGNAPFPFWFHLTPVEIQALGNAGAARQNDPEELLALALVASGNVRDSAGFEECRSRVKRFIEKVRPDMEREQDFREKAHRLFTAMFREFMQQGGKGYDFGQSRLSTLLETGSFDCASSSILYIVCAAFFKIPVKAVLLPLHIYVEVECPDGRRINVESTSEDGFDWAHDDAFFKGLSAASSSWFSERSLPLPTAEDFKKRRLLEPCQAVALNMSNQHTDPGRMEKEDIYRLKEMMAAVDRDNPAYQADRFRVYNLQFNDMHKRNDYASIDKMYHILMPEARFVRGQFPGDREVRSAIAVFDYNYVPLLLALHDYEGFVAAARQSLADAGEDIDDSRLIFDGAIADVINYMLFLTSQKDFAHADSLVEMFLPYAPQDSRFIQDVQWSWGEEERFYWNQRNWREVLRISRKQEAVDPEGKYGAMINGNIEGAYYNWAVDCINRGDTAEGREVLQKCLCDSVPHEKCSQLLRGLEGR